MVPQRMTKVSSFLTPFCLLALCCITTPQLTHACDAKDNWAVLITDKASGKTKIAEPGIAIDLNDGGTQCRTEKPRDVLAVQSSDPALAPYRRVEAVGLVCRFKSGNYVSLLSSYFLPKGEQRGFTKDAEIVVGDQVNKDEFGVRVTCVPSEDKQPKS